MAIYSNDSKPTVRMMRSTDGDFKVTIGERLIRIRPKGTRSADAEIVLPIGAIYQRGLMSRALSDSPPTRRKRVKRGLL